MSFNIFQLSIKYLRYYVSASNGRGHGTHSPFIYHFITKLLNDREIYASYQPIEELRKKLRINQRLLLVEDLGAGSAHGFSRNRSIASIARNAAKPKKWGQLLYRMAREYRPATILELGTSLGLTTSYLATGAPEARVITLEGSAAVAAVARQHFIEMGLRQITIVEGNFDDTLPGVLASHPRFDLIFMDGNHRQEPTERYFRQLLPFTGNDTIIIVDDIHWSSEMEMAWETIKADPLVRCTIDLFFVGIVVFRKEFREKQHFVVRF